MDIVLSIASYALLLLLAWQIWGSVWNIISIVYSLFKDGPSGVSSERG